MTSKTRSSNSKYNNPQNPVGEERLCEWSECDERGEYKAPRSRENLKTYQWFCLEHIRLFNKSWNYYEGMDDNEVEIDKRYDTVWQRPSWKLGMNAAYLTPDHTLDPFEVLGDLGPAGSKKAPTARPPISKEEEKAYKTLGVTYPATIEDLKSKYKELVKEHHPDANKGSKSSEEKIKKINQAYHTLQDAMKT